MTEPYRPRVTIELQDEDVFRILRQYIPWKLQNKVMATLISLFARRLKENPTRVLTSLLIEELDVMDLFEWRVESITVKEQKDGYLEHTVREKRNGDDG